MTVLAAKDPDVAAEYFIDFHDELIALADRRTWLEAGVVVYYLNDSGWYYETTTAGRTAARVPTKLPQADGETVKDGSAVLTCRHPGSTGVPSIASAVWTLPAGVSLDLQREVRTKAFFTVSGGEDGQNYDITVRVTASDGRRFDQTVTVPVRSQ